LTDIGNSKSAGRGVNEGVGEIVDGFWGLDEGLEEFEDAGE
jgi:hypothetical protein